VYQVGIKKGITPRVATQFKILLFTVLYDNVYKNLNSNGHCIYTYTEMLYH